MLSRPRVSEIRRIISEYPEQVYVDDLGSRYGVANDFSLREYVRSHDELETGEDLFWIRLAKGVDFFPELEKRFSLFLFLNKSKREANIEVVRYFAPKRKDRSGFVVLKVIDGKIREHRSEEAEARGKKRKWGREEEGNDW